MKHPIILVLFLLGCSSVLANSNFVSNPSLPYPPACAHPPIADDPVDAAPQTATFFERTIIRFDWQIGEYIELGLKAYRSRCSESDRSLIWLEFTLPTEYAGRAIEIALPRFGVALPGGETRPMQLVTEPGGWGSGLEFDREMALLVNQSQIPLVFRDSYSDGSVERKWIFLLDNLSPLSEWGIYFGRGLSAAEYNSRFSLVPLSEVMEEYEQFSIEVPATAELFPEPSSRLPLSGRHSGLWAIEGAADQGFQLSISEQVGGRADIMQGEPDLPLVIFFSQYTFDSEFRPMWLVGNVEFEPGASEITIPVARVSNGEFRGSKLAERETVGSVTLTSKNCNDLTFDYDYSALGLGAGSARMQRLFSLEIAGYDCRDYDARVEANTD
ncbi:MAG: hypothetical protein EHM68_14440 [Lysobacterales bacterium]|nr:MAG: hypothetical protein EHM68_14440 [Xanthomonadales bacterium]